MLLKFDWRPLIKFFANCFIFLGHGHRLAAPPTSPLSSPDRILSVSTSRWLFHLGQHAEMLAWSSNSILVLFWLNFCLTSAANIDNNVYNGARKLVVADSNFMSPFDIIECVKQLKIKNCEGYDRITQRILIDSV